MSYINIPAVQDFGGVYLLDTMHTGIAGKLGVYLLPGKNHRFALIETGPGSTLATIKKGIEEAGFELKNLDCILVTHIHLDHAGAAGQLALETGAHVYVHERGAGHLHDPSRLIESAQRIYTDQMNALWGTMMPIPEAQLRSLAGGESFKVLEHQIDAIYTPGHASHHISFLVNHSDLFAGDSAAICLTGSTIIRPALPPPDINLELWQDSINKMIEAKPKQLFLTHFGRVENAEAHLKEVPGRNQAWAEEILKGMILKESTDELIKRIKAFGDAELAADNARPEVTLRHQETSNYEMTVTGVIRYWQKFHPELLDN